MQPSVGNLIQISRPYEHVHLKFDFSFGTLQFHWLKLNFSWSIMITLFIVEIIGTNE